MFKNINFVGKIWAVVSLTLIFALLKPTSASALNFSTSYPTISSGYTVGDTLTAYPNTWTPTPDSFSYQWKRSGVAISGATGNTYKVTGADWGYYISVAVTGSKTGYTTVTQEMYSYTNGNYISVSGTLTNNAVITGSNRVGEFLYADVGTIPSGVSVTYTWYSNGWTIYGANGSSYQLQPSDLGDTIKVSAYLTGTGWSSRTTTSASTAAVLPAIPRAAINSSYYTLTGKNVIEAQGYMAYKSIANLRDWCFYLDGNLMPINTIGAPGIAFVTSGGGVVAGTRLTNGCYSPITAAVSVKVYIDVTTWSVGSHTLKFTVTDTDGNKSSEATTTVSVAKTAPTASFSGTQPTATKNYTFGVYTTTHSQTAPVRIFCVQVDGTPAKVVGLIPKANGTLLNATAILTGTFIGCMQASGNATTADVTINSEQFKNGDHTLQLKVISDDGYSQWQSDIVGTKVNFKNDYIPQVVFSPDSAKAKMIGTNIFISGKVTANIPEVPGTIVISYEDENGEWISLDTLKGVDTFNVPVKLAADSVIKVEVFDQNQVSKVTAQKDFYVSPSFSVSKTSVVLIGSTLSKSKTKSVTYKISSGRPAGAECTAKWSAGGRSGSKKFTLGKLPRYSFSAPNASGKFTVTCLGDNMTSGLPGFSGTF